jgi:hypothetical protein
LFLKEEQSLSEKYVKKEYDPLLEKKRLSVFESGCECGNFYEFQQQLIQNHMMWKEFPMFGLITHIPTGLSMHMSIKTSASHKCYTLQKLKERVRNTGTWILTPSTQESV